MKCLKYTYTPAIQAQLAEIEPMICQPSPNAALLASNYYSLGMMYQKDLEMKYATNGAEWPKLMEKSFALAKFYWEQLWATT